MIQHTTFELGTLEIRNATIGPYNSDDFGKTLTDLLQTRYPGIDLRYTHDCMCTEYGPSRK